MTDALNAIRLIVTITDPATLADYQEISLNSISEKCAVGYADEWARRFARGIEWGASDQRGQAILERQEPGLYEEAR